MNRAVIARYLTVGGATVDLTAEISNGEVGNSLNCEYKAACAGCKHSHQTDGGSWWDTQEARQELMEAQNLGGRSIRNWAQAHAETCRAIPQPAN